MRGANDNGGEINTRIRCMDRSGCCGGVVVWLSGFKVMCKEEEEEEEEGLDL